MKKLKFKLNEAFHFHFKLILIFFFIQTLTRIILLRDRPPGFIDSVDLILDGLLWDVYAWLIISFPVLLSSLFLPIPWIKKFNRSKFESVCLGLFSVIFIFIGFCEIIFWNEFHSRFNFIAVDYLIYTNEVLANLRESYPMGAIIGSVIAMAMFMTYGIQKIKFPVATTPLFKKRTSLSLFGVVLPLVFISTIGPWLENHDEDFHDDQLSRNGVVEFFRAFRSNHIDYKNFYPVLPETDVSAFIEQKKIPLGLLEQKIGAKKPNVIMIVVESLGAKFIGTLNGQPDTTPHLNKLSHESIFFENLYATGTRTVRGLEAINLSIPPTPGYAVVKRPNHKNLYSLGHTFLSNGYEPFFLYGGRGFFDNMNSFFEGNGFQVIDQGDFKKSEITFSNAWGVCDEDLFSKAITQIDQRSPEDKPFLMFMLTTSNHRPFTYPDGKIDIKSGESRMGAVKYTDYAIGKFLKDAQNKPWAKNTIFVVVADHSTEGRGQFDLEMSDFHIPMWIYSPDLIKPQKISKLGSQIDLLPSLIHLLGLKDNSPFYGQSFFNPNWTEERAFVGNYQYVGYYKNNILTTLGPNRIIRNFNYNFVTKKQSEAEESPYVNEAISYYQSASGKLDMNLYSPHSQKKRISSQL